MFSLLKWWAKAKGRPMQPGQLGAVAARPEQPHRRVLTLRRHRRDRPVAAEVRHQLIELLGEVVGAERGGTAPQGARRPLVRAGRTPDTEVDAARVQRVERAELLGDDERLVVGQHHTARADADPLGDGRQVGDQHGRRGARDPRHPVVLRHPVAPEPEILDELDELRAGRQRGRRRRAGTDGGEIENGERHHVRGNVDGPPALPGDHTPCQARAPHPPIQDERCRTGGPPTAQSGRGVTIR